MFSEWANKTWLRLKGLFKRRQLDRDLEDELAFHLAKREQRNLETGMEANEARYAARRQFGNVAWTKQRSHEMWTVGSREAVAQDPRNALRKRRQSTASSTVASLTRASASGAKRATRSRGCAARLKAP